MTERKEVLEKAVQSLAKGLTNQGIKGIEYDHEMIIYRTEGYKVMIAPKVHIDRRK